MIQARFGRRNGNLVSVSISGHAGYAAHGNDIVCASVTSALQLTCNGITEILRAPASVKEEDNRITLTLPPDGTSTQAVRFLQALHLHLELLSQDYPQNITTTVSEV